MEKGTFEEFIRDVNLVPELSVFVASNQQLKDVERFCTKVSSLNIFGIDPTCNIGNYYVTVTLIGIYDLILQRESIQFFWVLV